LHPSVLPSSRWRCQAPHTDRRARSLTPTCGQASHTDRCCPASRCCGPTRVHREPVVVWRGASKPKARLRAGGAAQRPPPPPASLWRGPSVPRAACSPDIVLPPVSARCPSAKSKTSIFQPIMSYIQLSLYGLAGTDACQSILAQLLEDERDISVALHLFPDPAAQCQFGCLDCILRGRFLVTCGCIMPALSVTVPWC
jgi:hypothetical protein